MHECIAVLVRDGHQLEATDQISTYMYISGSVDIGQWWDTDHENLINTYSLHMLKSHTHAETSHREHSRYQLSLRCCRDIRYLTWHTISRDILGINLQHLPRYSILGINIRTGYSVPAGHGGFKWVLIPRDRR